MNRPTSTTKFFNYFYSEQTPPKGTALQIGRYKGHFPETQVRECERNMTSELFEMLNINTSGVFLHPKEVPQVECLLHLHLHAALRFKPVAWKQIAQALDALLRETPCDLLPSICPNQRFLRLPLFGLSLQSLFCWLNIALF